MTALILIYDGPEMPHNAKQAIADALVAGGAKEGINMYNLNEADIVKILTEEVVTKTHKVGDGQKIAIVVPEKPNEATHHACVYIKKILGNTFRSSFDFIDSTLTTLNAGDNKLRNALEIISKSSKDDVISEGIPMNVYRAIFAMAKHHLILTMCKTYNKQKPQFRETHKNARPYKRAQKQRYQYAEDYV